MLTEASGRRGILDRGYWSIPIQLAENDGFNGTFCVAAAVL